jgi:hypothetical protein
MSLMQIGHEGGLYRSRVAEILMTMVVLRVCWVAQASQEWLNLAEALGLP